jgi:hypothetical protein
MKVQTGKVEVGLMDYLTLQIIPQFMVENIGKLL